MVPSNKINLEVANLSKRQIQAITHDIHVDNFSLDICPVDIESIIEKYYGLSIMPIPNLNKFHNIDAYITSNFMIVVDDNQYTNCTVRYRFSAAHELAHYVLHSEIYKQLSISSLEDHVKVHNRIPHEVVKTIEIQAYRFAGCILLPNNTFKPAIEEIFSEDNISNMTITDFYTSIDDLAAKYAVSKDVLQRQIIYYYPDIYAKLKRIIRL